MKYKLDAFQESLYRASVPRDLDHICSQNTQIDLKISLTIKKTSYLISIIKPFTSIKKL